MSVKTWKGEFYPVPAVDVSAAEAAAHSLRKWIGARPENLIKHDVLLNSETGSIIDSSDERVRFTSVTCALCARFYDVDYGESESGGYDDDGACRQCPLALVRGGVSCTNIIEDEESESPFDMLTSDRPSPEPMISWLEKAVAVVVPE